MDPFFFGTSSFTQESPILSLRCFPAAGENGAEIQTESFQAEDRYYQGVYAVGGKLYSSSLPFYERGMVIRYSAEYTQTRPEYLSSFALDDEMPSLRTHVSVHYPKAAKPAFDLRGLQGVKVDSTIEDGTSEWNIGKRAPFIASGVYRAEEWTPALHISFPPTGTKTLDWVGEGDYYLSQFNGEIPQNLESLEALSKGKTPEEILGYLRAHVRYHADSRGEFSVFPRSSESTLANGYGDCKGMSLLLMQLLKAAGYNSHLVLVTATPGSLQPLPDFPSLGHFDHMIVALENEKGELTFIDPTNDWARWDESAWYEEGQKCLVLERGKSRYVEVKLPTTARSLVQSENRLLDSAGAMHQEGHMEFWGTPSYYLHMALGGKKQSERSAELREILRDDYHLEVFAVKEITDSVGHFILEYMAPMGGSWFSFAKPGLILDHPGISLPGAANWEGTGWVRKRPMRQEDRWVFPQGKTPKLTLDSLQNDLGLAHWSVDGTTVTRSFVRNSESRVTSPEARAQLLTLLKNTAWVE